MDNEWCIDFSLLNSVFQLFVMLQQSAGMQLEHIIILQLKSSLGEV